MSHRNGDQPPAGADLERMAEIFPTPVGIYRLNDADAYAKAYVPSIIEDVRQSRVTPNRANPALLHSDATPAGQRWLEHHAQPLLDVILAAVRDYAVRLGHARDTEWLCSASWLNVCFGGGSQNEHHHGNAFFCFTYYLNYVAGVHAPLRFYKPPPAVCAHDTGFMQLEAKEHAYGGRYASLWEEPETNLGGRLLVWPAHVRHGYPYNPGHLRITISGNVVPKRLTNGCYALEIRPVDPPMRAAPPTRQTAFPQAITPPALRFVGDLAPGLDAIRQPLSRVRELMQVYATRIWIVRSCLAKQLPAAEVFPDLLPPAVDGLLPHGPVPLERGAIDINDVDDDGATSTTTLFVDEAEGLEQSDVATLLRAATVDWHALRTLAWLCGLTSVSLPSQLLPPVDLSQTLTSLAQPVATSPDRLHVADWPLVAAKRREERALALWLAHKDNVSSFQSDLR